MNAVLCVLPGAMAVALTVDRLFGEPPARVHPVVAMGRYLSAFESWLMALPSRSAFVGGAVAWCLGAAITVAMAWWVQASLWQWMTSSASFAKAAVSAVVMGLLLKPLLSWRMLEREVLAVERALGLGIDEGRTQVARLVSRDTSSLDADEVRETAIETLAENLNDSVIAPLFWFAFAGLPGAALYRFANTADAMWGYRGRWEWAGKWAARADDLLSWVPARLTALGLGAHPVRAEPVEAPVYTPTPATHPPHRSTHPPFGLGLSKPPLQPLPRRWSALRKEARHTPSPNGGWPMGAMALALGVRLRKPGVYALNGSAASPQPGDIERAIVLERRACALCMPALMALAAAMGVLR